MTAHAVETFPLTAQATRMICGEQIRAARAMLKWTALELATRAGLSYATVQRAENADGVPQMQTSSLLKIQRALESADIIFLEPGEQRPGGAGVRLRS